MLRTASAAVLRRRDGAVATRILAASYSSKQSASSSSTIMTATTDPPTSRRWRLTHQHPNPLAAPQQQLRSFHPSPLSLLSQAAAATEATTTNNSNNDDNKKKTQKDDKNLFLDNLGTIFLAVIGAIIAWLVRSYYGSNRRNELRHQLEQLATLDPLEIDELRRVNPTLTVAVFRSLLARLWKEFPSGQVSYPDFSEATRRILVQEHSVPTIEFGHLLDRIALKILGEQSPNETQSNEQQQQLPLSLWMTVLSLALYAPTPDRIQVMFEILQAETAAQQGDAMVLTDANDEMSDNNNARVTMDQVQRLVTYLQSTNQLTIEAQLVPTKDAQYPIQAYHCAKPDELLEFGDDDKNKTTNKTTDLSQQPVDVDALAAILRSRAVCAWGECYNKKFIMP